MKCFAVLALSLIIAGSIYRTRAAPTSNGLYAVFATTKGTFYCNLRYDLVPRTVANFVSLANGTKDWLDYSKASVVKRPFYNGLTFHRVVYDFVIQGGSPNGYGDDDPGYYFRNEVTNSLTHNKAGILAMANGGPNVNGAQFYVTLSAQPSLNGDYSIFGAVVEGMNVVTNINRVATNPTNSRPLVPVLMTNVTILRIGTAASNFNALAINPALPVPRRKESQIYATGPDLWLTWTPTVSNEYRMCYSPNLKNWDGFPIGTTPPAGLNVFRPYFSYVFFTLFESKID